MATQSDKTHQPIYQPAAANGHGALAFDGKTSVLNFSLPISGWNSMTMIMVAAADADQNGGVNGSQNSALSWDETGWWGSVFLSPFQSNIAYRFGTGQSGNVPFYSRPTALNTAFSTTAIVKNLADEFLFLDGSQVLIQSGKFSALGNVAASAHLGQGYSGFFAGRIAEVIIYNRALSIAELSQVQAYLDTKYRSSSNTEVSRDGLKLWLRSDAGLSLVGTKVSAWADQSGNARDAVQPDVSQQPDAEPNALNGLPLVRFDGLTTSLNATIPIDGLNAMTVILVSSSATDIDGGWNGTENSPLSWGESGSWGTVDINPLQRLVKFRFGTGQANNLPVYNRPQSVGSAFTVSTIVKKSSTEALFVNGEAVYSALDKLPTISKVSSALAVGMGHTGHFAGDIAEVLVYSRDLSTQERSSIEQYLFKKYALGIPDSSPPPAPVNEAPLVTAGLDQSITLPASAVLAGTASDDGLPSGGAFTTTWSSVSGPGSVSFSSANALSTTALFSAPGSYVLRLTAFDSVLSTTSDVTVTVTAVPAGSRNGAPVTYATADTVYPANIGYYNVQDYGAKGDGVNDDTDAIKAAIQDALAGAHQLNHGAGNRNSTVYFPAGTYLLSDSLLMAQYGNGDARVSAQIDPGRGCVTGFSIQNGGSGYGRSWSGGPALYLSGGGGSGVEAYTTFSGGSINGTVFGLGNKGTPGCAGHGYTSPPTVTVLNWRAYIRLEGQNKDTTILRLKDHTPRFSNPHCNIAAGADNALLENCPAVIYFANEFSSTSTGVGEDAYMNDFWNLTINTGAGNPGAIALDWVGSNRASIKNVNLLSADGAARCGLNVSRSSSAGPGPAYVKNLSVSGFDYGIDANVNATEVGNTFEYIDLANQQVAGILSVNAPNWFRAVSSSNTVPAVILDGSASLTLLDAQLNGGSLTSSAILNRAGNQGLLFARNVVSSGYVSALALGDNDIPWPGQSISEYASNQFFLFPSTMTSLNLPVKDTPDFVDNNFDHWADVSAFGAQPNTWKDVTDAIQAAMNSGKPVVYFPYGAYITSATIHIPNSVRKIVGANSLLLGPDGVRQHFPVFTCDSTSGNPVEIRNFLFDVYTVGFPTFQNNCSSDLVLADIFNANGYANSSLGTGDLYLENAAIPGLINISHQNVWARQLDIESGQNNHLLLDGAHAWIFGYKTEGAANLLTASNSTVEVLGAFHSNNNHFSAQPAYNFTNSSFSLADIGAYNGWPSAISETQNNIFRMAGANRAWQGGFGFGLYSSHQ